MISYWLLILPHRLSDWRMLKSVGHYYLHHGLTASLRYSFADWARSQG